MHTATKTEITITYDDGSTVHITLGPSMPPYISWPVQTTVAHRSADLPSCPELTFDLQVESFAADPEKCWATIDHSSG